MARQLPFVTCGIIPITQIEQNWDNLVVATGHSMMGLSMGPATGKIVTDFVTHGPTARTLLGCEVDRY